MSRATAADPNLALNEDVFFCLSEGQGIFLDLGRDAYSAVPLSVSHAGTREPPSDEEITAALQPFRHELLEADLLTECCERSAGFQAFRSITRPAKHICHPDDQRAFGASRASGQMARVSLTDVTMFFWASAKAARHLKNRHLRDIVRAVAKRKARRVGHHSTEDIRQNLAVFRLLRPWYPAGYLCIFDALALIEFLAMKNQFPTWVFGVQAQPFGAHCWVQVEDQVLNEASEYTAQFTPIMAI